jgi:hypothetical protein
MHRRRSVIDKANKMTSAINSVISVIRPRVQKPAYFGTRHLYELEQPLSSISPVRHPNLNLNLKPHHGQQLDPRCLAQAYVGRLVRSLQRRHLSRCLGVDQSVRDPSDYSTKSQSTRQWCWDGSDRRGSDLFRRSKVDEDRLWRYQRWFAVQALDHKGKGRMG